MEISFFELNMMLVSMVFLMLFLFALIPQFRSNVLEFEWPVYLVFTLVFLFLGGRNIFKK